MNRVASTARPDWVSGHLFPFENRFLALPPDHRMHYIDEGKGEPLVFVHGNPAWSFEFRHPVRELRSDFRCVALDHIGFGLSSRSARREDHRPESHARRLATLLDHLDLREITLFMTDWGGPIGLDFARKHSERVKRLVIANTWCWPVRDDFHFKSFSFLMSSWIGQFLLRQPSPAARAASAARWKSALQDVESSRGPESRCGRHREGREAAGHQRRDRQDEVTDLRLP